MSQLPERRAPRWMLAMLAAAVLAPAAFWFGETLSNLRASRRAHAAGDNVESRTAALDVAPTLTVSTRVEPPSAQIWLDRHPVATGELGIVLAKDGRTHELRAAAEGYIPVTLLFADVPPPKLIRLEALPAGAVSEPSAAAGPTTSVTGNAGPGAGSPATSTDRAGADRSRARDALASSPGGADGRAEPPAASVPPRAVPSTPRPSAPAKRHPPNAANLGADTTPSAAARVIEPTLPAPNVQIIDDGAPRVRVID
jgi:hypothetical protein